MNAAATTVADVVAALDSWYPPAWAEQWDRVGLVLGAPETRVSRIFFAVDVVEETVGEALDSYLLSHFYLLQIMVIQYMNQ